MFSLCSIQVKVYRKAPMPRKTPIVARTFAPIHFEDLDPHRFEDLVRELIYDFRDWRSIEATGRGGGDDGFDIRAFEKTASIPAQEEGEEASDEMSHPMDGPRWMIQGKREKVLTPAAVRKILQDVDQRDPPYGYILAASANFSKKSYDAFREELRAKGVMEFYLWGRAELEDMLHQPKNDRILFTFFGISLVSRRRSRTTEVRSTINTKNKLYKLLGGPSAGLGRNVLLRDIDDRNYPDESEYADFKKRPKWVERTVSRHHPTGLIVEFRECYAFVDRRKKQWDYTEHADLLTFRRMNLSDDERRLEVDRQSAVTAVWDFLPLAQQAKFTVDALLPYGDILLVDGEGDDHYSCPHLYLTFTGRTPYSGFFSRVAVRGEEIEIDDSWSRIEFFPKTFSPQPANARVYFPDSVSLDADTASDFRDFRDPINRLFAVDDRFAGVRPRTVIAISEAIRKKDEAELLLEVRNVHKGPFGQYLNDFWDKHRIQLAAERQVGREVSGSEDVTVLEVQRTYRET